MIGERDRILRLDAIGGHVLSLLELHDDILDERGTCAWAVTCTDRDGHLISDLGDVFISDIEWAGHRYFVLLDRLHQEAQ